MPDLDTAEYRKLALIAAGVPLESIPPIIDTATWRHMLIAALLKNAASQVLAGSVDYYSQLPTTLGSPAIGATYLVRNSSGVYYINYKSAGVYIKVLDTGSLTDWVYTPLTALGTLPDVTLTNPQVGQTITWNGSRWVNTNMFSPTITSPQSGQTLAWNGTSWINSDNTILNTFTSPGSSTFTIPAFAKLLHVICIGGGGGGGAGIRQGTGGAPFGFGGLGGSGGGLSYYTFFKVSGAAATATVNVGQGGNGGTPFGSQTGINGTQSSFQWNGVGELFAGGGFGGQGGNTSQGISGPSGGVAMFNGGGGGTTGSPNNTAPPNPSAGAGAGGVGGASSAGGVGPLATLGSNSVVFPFSGFANRYSPGAGGTGGGASTIGNGQNGGNGSVYGAGGGGGGSTFTGSNGGSGGNGASGAVIIFTSY